MKKGEEKRVKKIENEELQEKLDFLGLSLEKLPKFISDAEVPSFNISRMNNDKDLKVYKFIPIDKIEILLTPALRSDPIKTKYEEAVPLKFFLNEDGDEEEMMFFKTFSKIVRTMSIQEIEKVEKMQESFEGKEPFKVKYNRDHLWQIYYSDVEDRYFMLVCTKEDTFSEFLYLLKAQIEFSKKKKKDAPKIYVPIHYVTYSEEILQRSEIADLENYLWLFTKNWPLIFEVYDSRGEFSVQIVGETFVYRNIKSSYKVILKSTQEAIKFYKLLKALFILQTEIKGQYHFETRIDSNNGLSMYLSKVEITFDSLTQFIRNEYLLANYEIENQNKTIEEIEEKLVSLKKDVKEKEDEYLQKQKEISTYLECKKTFIGKVKYFFKLDKKDKRRKNMQNTDIAPETESIKIDTQPLNVYMEEKKFYTIEDLVTIYALHEKSEKRCKDLKQDLKALELKLENLVSKVRNANQYIEEIDKHKKSIFEFWKFANKDEKLAIEMGEDDDQEKDKNQVKKSFDFEMDFEKLGEEVDQMQRTKLSHEETDSVFIAQTELLWYINMVRSNKIVKYDLEMVLDKLKEEFNEDRLVVDTETFDIFGNIEENNNKLKYIGSRSHREFEKSKFKIMNINRKIDVFDFTEKMQSIVNFLEGAMPKITSKFDMPLYKLVPISNQMEENEFEIYNIDIENELSECQEDGEGAYNLICLNYKEEMPLLYYSNIMFYDNTNKTLPLGMNLSSKVLVDNRRLEFSLVNKTKFRTNGYFGKDENMPKCKDVFVYEYDVALKMEKEEIPEVPIEPEIHELVKDLDIEKEEQEQMDLYQNIDSLDDLEEAKEEPIDRITAVEDVTNQAIMPEEKEIEESIFEIPEEPAGSYIDPNEHIQEEVIEQNNAEEQLLKKSKKLMKLQQKLTREMEKEQKKEEKARQRLEKKVNKAKRGK